jgi:hypothetical protein
MVSGIEEISEEIKSTAGIFLAVSGALLNFCWKLTVFEG